MVAIKILNVVVGVSAEGYPWPGEIDGKPFRMSVPPRNEEDGEIDWLIVSLYGQDSDCDFGYKSIIFKEL